jgi:hypothetical protein
MAVAINIVTPAFPLLPVGFVCDCDGVEALTPSDVKETACTDGKVGEAVPLAPHTGQLASHCCKRAVDGHIIDFEASGIVTNDKHCRER